MSDIIKTNQLFDDTDARLQRVIYRGETTITMASTAAGYAGSTTVTKIPLGISSTNIALPYVKAFWQSQGGGTTTLLELPFTDVNTATAAVTQTGNMSVSFTPGIGNANNLIDLTFTLFKQTSTTATIVYLVYSTQVPDAINGDVTS